MADSYVIELALASLSVMRELGPKLLFRLSDLGGPCEDLDRNRLLLLDSLSSTETTDALRSKGCSTSLMVSGIDEFAEEEAGEGGGGRALMRAFEKRQDVVLFEKLFEKPLGLNRPAVT